MSRPEYLTPDEFWLQVKQVAARCGYEMNEPQHPDDIVANVVPMMEAFAAGATEAIFRGAQGRKSDFWVGKK